MRRIKIVLEIVLMCFMFLNLIIPVYCQADNFDTSSYGTLRSDVPQTVTKLTDNFIGTAINVVRIVGVSLALVIIMVIACKYMMSSPGDRADIKKNAIPFVIGAVVLFATSGILGIIAEFAGLIQA